MVDASAGNSKFYLDGAISDTLGFAIATTSGGTDTRLGRQFGPHGEFFKGDLDNFKIFDSALTAAEVAGTATPEPSTIFLLLSGATLRFLRRHR